MVIRIQDDGVPIHHVRTVVSVYELGGFIISLSILFHKRPLIYIHFPPVLGIKLFQVAADDLLHEFQGKHPFYADLFAGGQEDQAVQFLFGLFHEKILKNLIVGGDPVGRYVAGILGIILLLVQED